MFTDFNNPFGTTSQVTAAKEAFQAKMSNRANVGNQTKSSKVPTNDKVQAELQTTKKLELEESQINRLKNSAIGLGLAGVAIIVTSFFLSPVADLIIGKISKKMPKETALKLANKAKELKGSIIQTAAIGCFILELAKKQRENPKLTYLQERKDKVNEEINVIKTKMESKTSNLEKTKTELKALKELKEKVKQEIKDLKSAEASKKGNDREVIDVMLEKDWQKRLPTLKQELIIIKNKIKISQAKEKKQTTEETKIKTKSKQKEQELSELEKEIVLAEKEIKNKEKKKEIMKQGGKLAKSIPTPKGPKYTGL